MLPVLLTPCGSDSHESNLAPPPHSYGFLVKHQWLWRFNFEFTSVKPVSALMFAVRLHTPLPQTCLAPSLTRLWLPPTHTRPASQMYGTLLSRHFAAAFDTYVPDLVVSVHPLMQHIPVRMPRATCHMPHAPTLPVAHHAPHLSARSGCCSAAGLAPSSPLPPLPRW
jgi:hypothetical protein